MSSAAAKGRFLEPDYGTADTNNYLENWEQPSLEPAQAATPFHINYLKNFFDLDTSDFLSRSLRALFPIGKKLLDSPDNAEPDIYGWVWIPTSVILVLSVNSSLYAFFKTLFSDQQELSVSRLSGVNFRKFWIFSILVYGYNVVIPGLLWSILLCSNLRQPLTHMLCIYGYSCTAYIFASLLCIVPIKILYIVSFVIAALLSSLALYRNILKEDDVVASSSSRVTFQVAATLLQMAFGVGLLMVFLYGT